MFTILSIIREASANKLVFYMFVSFEILKNNEKTTVKQNSIKGQVFFFVVETNHSF